MPLALHEYFNKKEPSPAADADAEEQWQHEISNQVTPLYLLKYLSIIKIQNRAQSRTISKVELRLFLSELQSADTRVVILGTNDGGFKSHLDIFDEAYNKAPETLFSNTLESKIDPNKVISDEQKLIWEFTCNMNENKINAFKVRADKLDYLNIIKNIKFKEQIITQHREISPENADNDLFDGYLMVI